ncbi:hypothetical protein [Hymenobacter arizonensis]|uniref:hypothetical protein n=1 Tax=Hymenobacter arizonensis TaxID=1227077 RepID=UPI0015A68C02|nr:hypothetical protein [Hymenobacter arizonensis]
MLDDTLPVMLSLPKHLYRFVESALITSEVEMLRQAQHDRSFWVADFPDDLKAKSHG